MRRQEPNDTATPRPEDKPQKAPNVVHLDSLRRAPRAGRVEIPRALPFEPPVEMPAPAIAPTRSSGAVRRWTINGDFTTLAPAGVARYAREVTLALDEAMAQRHPWCEGLEVELVVPRPVGDSLPLKAISVRVVPEFARPRIPQFWVQVQLPRHTEGGLLSFCNLAPVAVRRQIVCIHDLHTRLMPESYGRAFRLAHRVILPLLGRRVAHITTVSRFSRQHLAEFAIAPSEKVTVTHNGSDHVARWRDGSSDLRRKASQRPYVLCLGRNQKYKNVELLARIAPTLHCMGLDTWMAGDVDVSALGSHRPAGLRLLGRIDDNDLKSALSGALCFLFPSRIEGFGLPAIEAMAAGCPVIASTSPCLPEVCGDAALYADPDDTSAWVSLIGQLRQDPRRRRALVEAGLERAGRYTWRGIAETYLRLMAGIDGARIPAGAPVDPDGESARRAEARGTGGSKAGARG